MQEGKRLQTLLEVFSLEGSGRRPPKPRNATPRRQEELCSELTLGPRPKDFPSRWSALHEARRVHCTRVRPSVRPQSHEEEVGGLGATGLGLRPSQSPVAGLGWAGLGAWIWEARKQGPYTGLVLEGGAQNPSSVHSALRMGAWGVGNLRAALLGPQHRRGRGGGGFNSPSHPCLP